MAGHLGRFGRAVTASARRRRRRDEGALDKPADRLGAARLRLRLPFNPGVQRGKGRR
jgi:hypothetical protein